MVLECWGLNVSRSESLREAPDNLLGASLRVSASQGLKVPKSQGFKVFGDDCGGCGCGGDVCGDSDDGSGAVGIVVVVVFW